MRLRALSQAITWLVNEKYNGRLTDKAKKDINRLKKAEPLDYIIGYKKFLGCKIDLRYKPFIPREETEFWVGQAVKSAVKKNSSQRPARFAFGATLRVLDMFAGSGCCGIAFLKNMPLSHCTFVDIDEKCLKQIKLNLRINGIAKHRYQIIKSNLFSQLHSQDAPYNIIMANPPYISFARKNKVQKSVLDFEPQKALFAKNNGLYFIEAFLKRAKDFLAPNGIIYLELGDNQKREIEKILKKFAYKNFDFHKDQFGKWRYLKMKN